MKDGMHKIFSYFRECQLWTSVIVLIIIKFNNIMFSVIVLAFELVCLLFIGIFARTTDITAISISNSNLLTQSFVLMLAFTLMYSPFRKLSLFSLSGILLSIGIGAQSFILWGTFWDSCYKGFNSSFTITIQLLIRSVQSSFCILLICFDFIGLFNYWQVYFLIGPIAAFGYAFCSSTIVYGLNTFDGGAGMQVFLYSGVVSLLIWVVSIRGKLPIAKYQIQESYLNHTLSFVGLVIAMTSWPAFNMAGALVSANNIDTTGTSSSNLQNSAIGNTIIALSTALICGTLLASKDSHQQKLKPKIYIDCFVNGGIVIASFQDIALYPVIGMVMVVFSSILTLIVHKHLMISSDTSSESKFKIFMNYFGKVIFRIVFSFLGSIIASIVVAARQNVTPNLTTYTYSTIAGFEILAFLVVSIIAAIFGLIIGVVINVFIKYKANLLPQQLAQGQKTFQISDSHYFGQLNEQMYPLYFDVFAHLKESKEKPIDIEQYTSRIIKESLLGAKENPLRSHVTNRNVQSKVDSNNKNRSRVSITKNFSKKDESNPSALKIKEAPQEIVEDPNVQRRLDYDEPPIQQEGGIGNQKIRQ